MTDSKKSATSASSPKFKRDEATTHVNPPNAVPCVNKKRPERYLYGGMLFPSRVIAAKETGLIERD